MKYTLLGRGVEELLVLSALQAAKEGVIKSEYSGTVRLSDYIIPTATFRGYILAWLKSKVDSNAETLYPELLVDNIATGVIASVEDSDVDDVINGLLATGRIQFNNDSSAYDIRYINKGLGYTITSQSNIPDQVVAWGCDGVSALYSDGDDDPILYGANNDESVYLAQFPRYRVTGNDIIIVLGAVDALIRVAANQNIDYQTPMANLRKNIPVQV